MRRLCSILLATTAMAAHAENIEWQAYGGARGGGHYSTEEFTTAVFGDGDEEPAAASTLAGFIQRRRSFLLAHPEIQALDEGGR